MPVARDHPGAPERRVAVAALCDDREPFAVSGRDLFYIGVFLGLPFASIGVLADKDWRLIIRELSPLAHRILLLPVRSERGGIKRLHDPQRHRAANLHINTAAEQVKVVA